MPVAADRLFDADVCGDPYPLYRELFADAPVVPSERGWLVGGYHQATAVLRDPRFGHDTPPATADVGREDRISRLVFIRQNPPEHTRLRGLVSKAFTPRSVAALRPAIEALVDDLLLDLPAEADLIAHFAAPLPVAVISEMLGIPVEDRAAFRAWSEDMVVPDGPEGETPEWQARWREASRHFLDYLTELIDHRRRQPQDDMVSRLVATGIGEDDLLATCQLLLFAGHETTVNLIANGVLALLRNPDQLDRLRRQPELIDSAVEELLRYDGPVHLTARTALEPVDFAEAGDYVIVVLGAANRDPARFDDPDRLDIGRERNQHLGFGAGIHYCLGAPLARLEAQIALPRLLQKDLALTGEELTWRHSLMLRGLNSLPVAVR